MSHLIWNGFIRCPEVPLRNLRLLSGRPRWVQGEGKAREDGQSPAPALALYGDPGRGGLQPKPKPAVPGAPGAAPGSTEFGVRKGGRVRPLM